MIEISDLNFAYGSTQVLHDISLSLPQGSITGLVGPNGAGKSTLMRCIAGLEIPQSGEVRLQGIPILADPQYSFSQIGYLPDQFDLYEGLTVVQCLTYSAKARGVEDGRLAEAVVETARLLNLDGKLRHPVHSLSRGQKQRVGIGQVVIHRPKFLILDEPAGGLDPEARYELSQLFRTLRSEGMTLLVSSHILSELDEYCTHMLAIREGSIQTYRELQHGGYSGTADIGEGTLLLMAKFAADISEAADTLCNAPHVRSVRTDGTEAVFLIDADPACRTALIRYLVAEDLPLIGVEPLRESLLEHYRAGMKQSEGDGAAVIHFL